MPQDLVPQSAAAPSNADSPKSTLFPGLYDGSPGDNPEHGADVTGQFLPALNDGDNEPLAKGAGETISSVPGPAAVEGASAPAPRSVEIDDGVRPGDHPGRRRTAEERIAQLTRHYRREQEQRTGLERELEKLVGVVMNQQEQIQNLTRPAIRPTVAANPLANAEADLLGLGSGGAGGSLGVAPNQPFVPQPAPSLTDIERAVDTAISRYDSRVQQQQTAVAELQASHEQSFTDAVGEFPELADARTPARKLFNRLYATSPLKGLPDAPYQIALQVRGILADEAAGTRSQTTDARKRQASLVVPQPSTHDIPTDANRAQTEKRFSDLTKLRRAGNDDFGVYREWRFLREKLRKQ